LEGSRAAVVSANAANGADIAKYSFQFLVPGEKNLRA
jgi:hypothetical protein